MINVITHQAALGQAATTHGEYGSGDYHRVHGQHRSLLEGDTALRNQYSLIVVNPRKHPATKVRAAQALADWLRSPTGQSAIAAFKPRGLPLFHPNAEAMADAP